MSRESKNNKFTLIEDFYDDLIDEDLKAEAEKEIEKDPQAKEFYERLLELSQRMKFLSNQISPPENILEEIQSDLLDISEIEEKRKEKIRELHRQRQQKLSKGKDKEKQKRSKEKSYAVNRKLIITLVILIIALGSIFPILNYLKKNTPWIINDFNGIVDVNGHSSIIELYNGDVLATENESSAEITIPDLGTMKVLENSKFILIKGHNDQNIIKVEKGTFNIITTADYASMVIETPAFELENEGANFSFSIFQNGNAEVKVSDGYVRYYKADMSFVLTSDYELNVDATGIPHVPIRTSVNEELITALNSFESGRQSELLNIIKYAEEEDGLTLFYLITQFRTEYEHQLIAKLEQFFPMPEGVTESGILESDQQMIDLWWDEIEWQL